MTEQAADYCRSVYEAGFSPICPTLYLPLLDVYKRQVLGFAVLLLLTPTRVLAALLSRGNYLRFRGVTYAVTAAVLYIGVWFAANALFGVGIQTVGLYLPLLVVEPIIIKRYERPQKERVSTALRKGLITTCGFLLALFLVAALRELLGAGALFGHPVAARPALQMCIRDRGNRYNSLLEGT